MALKILPKHLSSDPAFVQRFKLEAVAQAKLTHPNIVMVHAIGEHEGSHFIAMEYVEGADGAPGHPRQRGGNR